MTGVGQGVRRRVAYYYSACVGVGAETLSIAMKIGIRSDMEIYLHIIYLYLHISIYLCVNISVYIYLYSIFAIYQIYEPWRCLCDLMRRCGREYISVGVRSPPSSHVTAWSRRRHHHHLAASTRSPHTHTYTHTSTVLHNDKRQVIRVLDATTPEGITGGLETDL